jgi:predicted DsbA family dithiol-disulfide isomerase
MRARGIVGWPRASRMLASLFLLLGATVWAEDPAAAGSEAVAIVAGTPIPADALEAAVGPALVELRMREDALRRQALDELIAQVLIQKEAAARGVTPAALEKAEITDKAQVTPAEARTFYEANKARFASMAEADALDQIQAGLGRQRERERRATFARSLRETYGVQVLLEPFRVPVALADAPIRGNPDAPVTVVEFSDFQCPYCARSRPTVNRVREVYGDKVRWAFRHFPLGFHTQAPKAGEAAACAGDQGKFWAMHDHLFANPGKLSVPDLKTSAADLGLDTAAFDQCLDSGKHADRIVSDSEAGARYGVSGTPAFFINGRPLIGAQPFEAFAQVIDDELARLGQAKGTGAGAGGR